MEEFISGENFTTKEECCLSSRIIFLILKLTVFFLVKAEIFYVHIILKGNSSQSHLL